MTGSLQSQQAQGSQAYTSPGCAGTQKKKSGLKGPYELWEYSFSHQLKCPDQSRIWLIVSLQPQLAQSLQAHTNLCGAEAKNIATVYFSIIKKIYFKILPSFSPSFSFVSSFISFAFSFSFIFSF